MVILQKQNRMAPSSNFWFPPQISFWCQNWWCTHALRGYWKAYYSLTGPSNGQRDRIPNCLKLAWESREKWPAAHILLLQSEVRMRESIGTGQHHRRRQPSFLSAYPDVGQEGYENDCVKVVNSQTSKIESDPSLQRFTPNLTDILNPQSSLSF